MRDIYIPAPQETVSHEEVKRLTELGRWAQKVFLALEHGNKGVAGNLARESLSTPETEKMTDFLNHHLERGGEVVILDFPSARMITGRAQVLTSESYVRQNNGDFGAFVMEKKKGDFSVWVSSWDSKDGSLYAGVEELSAGEVDYYTSWEGQDPYRRFAILTHQGNNPRAGGKWETVLDFVLPGEAQKPSWIVGPNSHSLARAA